MPPHRRARLGLARSFQASNLFFNLSVLDNTLLAIQGRQARSLQDEPPEGLAPVMVLELSQIIAQLKENGLSILLVEQNVGMALELSDYAYVLNRGEVVYRSEPEELRDNEELRNRYLGVAK